MADLAAQDDNIIVQIGAAVMLFFVLAGWGIGFDAPDHLNFDGVAPFGIATAVKECPAETGGMCAASGGVASQIGQIVFNYAYVVTLPSWINEMKPGLSVNKQLWGALLPGVACFCVLGYPSSSFFKSYIVIIY